MEILAAADISDWAEDRWTGCVLSAAGIELHEDNRYAVINTLDPQNLPLTETEGPLAWNDVIVVAEFEPAMMKKIHVEYLASYHLSTRDDR
jgi:hypothetical protein